MKKTTAQSAVFTGRAIASATNHPLQRNLKFVFTDFEPNGNKQGVPQSEAQNVLTSSLYMPVKIAFDGDGPTGHKGADPIGPIVNMYNTPEQIVGEAVVWIDEFPDIDDYLMSASAEGGEGVQFSWELYFENSEKDANGVEWLHDITSAGICIVENPAYQGRTPLIAIAEGTQMNELEQQASDLMNRLYSMVDALWAALALPGALDRAADVEAQFQTVLQSLIDQIGSAQAAQSALESAQAQVAALESEAAELRSFRAQVEATAQRQQVLASRREQLAAAGVTLTDEQLAERADRVYEMTDEVFALYVADLASARTEKSERSSASQRVASPIIPDPQALGRPAYTISDLAAALRSARN